MKIQTKWLLALFSIASTSALAMLCWPDAALFESGFEPARANRESARSRIELRQAMDAPQAAATRSRDEQTTSVTIPAGRPLEEVAQIVANQAPIQASEFLSLARNPDFWKAQFPFLNELPPRASLEGYLVPDTYRVPMDRTAAYELIKLALTNYNDKVNNRRAIGGMNSRASTQDTLGAPRPETAEAPAQRGNPARFDLTHESVAPALTVRARTPGLAMESRGNRRRAGKPVPAKPKASASESLPLPVVPLAALSENASFVPIDPAKVKSDEATAVKRLPEPIAPPNALRPDSPVVDLRIVVDK